MGGRSRQTYLKRQRENLKRRKKMDKAERREQRKLERSSRAPVAPGEDPDIAGIVPGPQPPPWADDEDDRDDDANRY